MSCMTDDAPERPEPVVITRDGLADGSLLANIRNSLLPGMVVRSDEEIAASLEQILASHDPAADLWVFGYGSLMWNPAFDYAERQIGVVRGWHRRFCLWLEMGRGSPDNPGLMLALDRGGTPVGCRLPHSSGGGSHGAVDHMAARDVRDCLPGALGGGPDGLCDCPCHHLRRQSRSFPLRWQVERCGSRHAHCVRLRFAGHLCCLSSEHAGPSGVARHPGRRIAAYRRRNR